MKESQEPVAKEYASFEPKMKRRFETMMQAATAGMIAEAHSKEQVRHELYLNMRYEGSDTALMILKPPHSFDFQEEFRVRHRREFSFTSDRPVVVDDIRVRTIASTQARTEKSPLKQLREASIQDVAQEPTSISRAYFGGSGHVDTPVYLLDKLEKGSRVRGPAVIIDQTQTIVIVSPKPKLYPNHIH